MAGQNLTPQQYYPYLLIHCCQICSLACQIDCAASEKRLIVLQSSIITNGGDDICGDHSQISHFASVARYGMWQNICCVLTFVGRQ